MARPRGDHGHGHAVEQHPGDGRVPPAAVQPLYYLVNRDIEVECLPSDIPEHVDIDISELMLHQGVRVRDLPKNDKWAPVSDAEMMIVHVVSVKVEEAPAVDAAAAPVATAEPEVIKKGKKDEDAAAAPAEKKDKK